MDRLLIRILLAILVASAELASSKSLPGATYDQRQEGKVNVQIDVKGVQIVALVDSESLDDYLSYDYAYDYSDFTIKPGNRPTTHKPISTITKTTSTTALTSTKASTAASSTSVVTDSSGAAAEASSTTPVTTTAAVVTTAELQTRLDNKENATVAAAAAADVSQKKEDVQQQQQKVTTEATATDDIKPDGVKRPPGRPEARKKCPVGFLLKNGRCFKRRLSIISPRAVLSKLAPTLLSKALAQGAAASSAEAASSSSS